jgi:threonine dehydrogenase-like Zn-dependent dehydrogenase
MRAVVTEQVGAMAIRDRPEPPSPGPGDVVVAPEATGICGSDYHFFAGELSDAAGGAAFPRVQGHEVAATIVALGPGCRDELAVGRRVALLPLRACGRCYPCSVGRPNTCDNFELIGIHVDGGLQERLSLPQEQVFPIAADDAAIASMTEPVSIAVRAINRPRVQPGERLVVLGAGPIGQCVSLVARERGAEVLVFDLQERRLRLSRARRGRGGVDGRSRRGRGRSAVGRASRPTGRRRRYRRARGGAGDGRHGGLRRARNPGRHVGA